MTLIRSALATRGSVFENPAIPLTDVGLLDIFGGTPTDAGVNVTEETTMAFTTTYRCVSFLAGLVAGLPLKVYRYKDKTEVINRAIASPGIGTTPFERVETIMLHLLLWGNAYVAKVRNPLGSIIELRPIHPRRVKPDLLGPDDQSPEAGKVFVITDNAGQPHPYTSYEIMHIPGLSYDGVRGISPLTAMRMAAAIGIAGDKLAAKLYGNGSLMSGILSTDRVLKQHEADALKQRWREKVGGISHGHDIAVLDAGTTFHPVSMPPEEAQFLQSRRWQSVELARVFGIPPHLVGDVEKTTSWGTGIEQQNIGFVAYTVRTWLTRIEQRYSREVVEPSTQYAEFLVDGLLRGDTTERYAAYQTAVYSGWLTRNEVRVKENLQPLPGLDEPLVPAMKGSLNELIPATGPNAGNPMPLPPPPAPPEDK